MASSTSSFKERSLCVFLLAALLVAGVVALNHRTPDPVHTAEQAKEQFWRHKVHALPAHSFNIVASGDSRVYRGLSPDILEKQLHDMTAINYGFSSGGHNPFMFQQIENLLVKDGTRVIILGITPASLTPKNQKNEAYDDYFRKGPGSVLERAEDVFYPMDSKRLKQVFLGQDPKPDNTRYEYLDNGYMRSDWLKHDPAAELPIFETYFDGNKVDQRVIDGLMDQTRKWTGQHINVIAYRPPTTPEMEAVELKHSGFNEKSFIEQFRQNGGIWINLKSGVKRSYGYESYDGSHLTPESADHLSKNIAGNLRNIGCRFHPDRLC